LRSRIINLNAIEMHKIEELKIWQKSIELAKEVYKVVADLPNEERFSLASQIKRCTVSIASNIAEGAGRNSNKEFKYFLGIANGSSYELQTQLILTQELNLIDKNKITTILNLIIEIQKMNYSFQKRIEK
jgi:four helix bundle protein